VAPASEGESQLIMPQQRLQVIPLDVFMQGVQNGKRQRRRNATAAKDATGVSVWQTKRQAKPQGKAEHSVQPVTALLYQSVVAMQQEQAEAKRLQKVKPQQIIQPVTALQFLSVLTKELEQVEANQRQPDTTHSSSTQEKQPAIQQQEQPAAQPVPAVTQSPSPQPAPAKPTRKRKPAVKKPVVQPPPIIPQPPPQQAAPPVWVWFLRGMGLAVSFLYHLYGGAIGMAYALFFLLPQTFLVVVLFLFPTLFPANSPRPPWEHFVSTALLLLAYTITAYQHCEAVKHHNKFEQDDIGTLPIICLYSFYLLAWFLAAKVFL
jgi:hypothetical protein